MTLHALTSPAGIPGDAPAVALFLHGYGSNEQDLTALAPVLPPGIPWASLRAPGTLNAGQHAWFDIVRPGDPDPAPLAAATDAVWAWVDATVPATTRVVPLGFSQGGLMASQLLRTRPERVLAPAILGGFVQAAAQPGDALLADARPALFWGRGADDGVITSAAIARTRTWVDAHTTVTDPVYPGLGHGVDGRELCDLTAFLAAELSTALAPVAR
ncbi:phospholipase/carboxylesterase [Tersicoccus solisilvae]|uniref:Phospholipase/carboxylesterase n=1 Tax=Tersicoccus solisilvae TaxID=1882339 RepID=A0ABQ1PFV3_9MICC|nr:hypothetical protein [Tersicoccus solisilvae]GGC96462.1 phospholipase/carboxylesterase [Tersicoccus solisilvae]